MRSVLITRSQPGKFHCQSIAQEHIESNFIKLAIRRSRLEIGLNISHTTMKKRIILIHIYEEGKEDFPSFYM